MSEKFETLKIEGWRQFHTIDVALHPQLTIITGANGAGKSSLLQIFSRHFGWNRPYLSTPVRSKNGSEAFLVGVFEEIVRTFFKRSRSHRPGETVIGSIKYMGGKEATLSVPHNPGHQYNISFHGMESVLGVHIDSHRPTPRHQLVTEIPTNVISAEQAFSNYDTILRNRYSGGSSEKSATHRMKEALISMATFGQGNTYVDSNPGALSAYLGFIEILRKILPESIGFKSIRIQTPEVIIETDSGNFPIDASSGGLMALLDIGWRLHTFSLGKESFVVTMDEPENHLHPTMQRSLMRKLIAAFPQAQFIVATHSPFIVSAVKDSSVYVLRYRGGDREGDSTVLPTEMRVITSELLDTINKAGTASEILREVLGVPATIPEWVEEGLSIIVERHKNQGFTKDSLIALRKELAQVGYSELYTEALNAILEDKNLLK